MKNEQFLTELLSEISVSGQEEESLSKVAAHMEPYADEIRRDELGDVVCVLNPEKTPRILAAAHGDEIGLMVHYISEEGYLYVTSRGGFPPQLYLGHQVKVLTNRGILYGTVVFSRELLEKKDLKVKELSIDIGARDKEDAAAKVSLGDVVVFDSQIRTLANGRFSARALDDRLGVFIVMEAFKRAKERGTQNGVYCAATAGEETSLHGAYFTAARVEPDVAIVVDVYLGKRLSGDGSQGHRRGGPWQGSGPLQCPHHSQMAEPAAFGLCQEGGCGGSDGVRSQDDQHRRRPNPPGREGDSHGADLHSPPLYAHAGRDGGLAGRRGLHRAACGISRKRL